jgi:hypothetical protein
VNGFAHTRQRQINDEKTSADAVAGCELGSLFYDCRTKEKAEPVTNAESITDTAHCGGRNVLQMA